MNRTITTIIIIVAIALLAALFFALGGNAANEADENEGRLYVSFTDAAADMEAVSEIEAEVESVEVYSAANGWTTVSSDARTYHLLELRDRAELELFANAVVEAGSYEQVRVRFGDINVVTTDGETHAATSLTSETTVTVPITVEEQTDSHVTIDVLADKSLHTDTDGEYVFAAALNVESRSRATVSVDNSNRVTVSGGSVDGTITIGTDVDGSVKTNFELPSDASIDVSLMGAMRSSTDASNEGSMEAGADTSSSVNVDGDSVDADTSVNGELQLR